MTKYFSAAATAFYDDSVAGLLPPDAVAVSDADWSALLTAQSAGQIIAADAAGHPVATPPPPPALADVRTTSLAAIDVAAETARRKHITPGAGQAMSYRGKAAEATNCLTTYTAAAPPPIGAYPLLDSEVGITPNADGTATTDAYQIAVIVDAARRAWVTAEAAINKVRAQAKADVKAAATVAAIDAILAAVVWP
ncbi:hypothetical protein [Varunaivibrio sulfuroxidans]|uniref:Tail fiber assembly protein n=1 Tax=Varunaivibrio sulfuroxidans TaxID=1773489 RepID=A0A4R3J9P7_9PROT|nr:hypothetical protein [Varunaivibrio sulfuroxidans]TCS62598.1 hypothetical protein EDD55_105144 [Varunaivibrio sulfuroxidans]WES30733.1 hypothetical protein P3M64_14050 [Varunaivibrio sulfuroxidans]